MEPELVVRDVLGASEKISDPYLSWPEWLRTNEATVALQTSRKTMTRRIKDGYFVLGDNFVQIGPHKTATRIWNIKRCRETQARWDGPSPVC